MCKEKPVIVKDADGRQIARYVSTKECSRCIGISSATLTYRIRVGRIFDGLIYEYENKDDIVPLSKSRLRDSPRVPKPLDEKYRILHYDVKHERICITKCPYRDGNANVFIGSAKCEKCPSFKGRDRENHKIACNYNMWSKQ